MSSELPLRKAQFLISPLNYSLFHVEINAGLTAIHNFRGSRMYEIAIQAFKQKDRREHDYLNQWMDDAICGFRNRHLIKLFPDPQKALSEFKPNQPFTLRVRKLNSVQRILSDPEGLFNTPPTEIPTDCTEEEEESLARLIEILTIYKRSIEELDQHFQATDSKFHPLRVRCIKVLQTLRTLPQSTYRIALMQKSMQLLSVNLTELYQQNVYPDEVALLEDNTHIFQTLFTATSQKGKGAQAPSLPRGQYEECENVFTLNLLSKLSMQFGFSSSSDAPPVELPLPEQMWKEHILGKDHSLTSSEGDDPLQFVWRQLLRTKLLKTLDHPVNNFILIRENLSNTANCAGQGGALGHFFTEILNVHEKHLHSELRMFSSFKQPLSKNKIDNIPPKDFHNALQNTRSLSKGLQEDLFLYLLIAFVSHCYHIRSSLEKTLKIETRIAEHMKLERSSQMGSLYGSMAQNLDPSSLFDLNRPLKEDELRQFASLSSLSPEELKKVFNIKTDNTRLEELKNTLESEGTETTTEYILTAFGISQERKQKASDPSRKRADSGSIQPDNFSPLSTLKQPLLNLMTPPQESKPSGKLSWLGTLNPLKSSQSSPSQRQVDPANGSSNNVSVITAMTKRDPTYSIYSNPSKVVKLLALPPSQLDIPDGDEEKTLLNGIKGSIEDHLIPSLQRVISTLQICFKDDSRFNDLRKSADIIMDILTKFKDIK